jgi:hypothetical protein
MIDRLTNKWIHNRLAGLAPLSRLTLTFDRYYLLKWRVTMKKSCPLAYLFIFLFICFFSPLSLYADEKIGLSDGQTIYVPAYSHIYSGVRDRPFLLTVTLSIRNIDPRHKIKITTVDYYETKEKLIKKHLDKPVILNPLDSIRYIIPERDKTGGSGANFIVEWKSDKLVNPPIIESVMIAGTARRFFYLSRSSHYYL